MQDNPQPYHSIHSVRPSVNRLADTVPPPSPSSDGTEDGGDTYTSFFQPVAGISSSTTPSSLSKETSPATTTTTHRGDDDSLMNLDFVPPTYLDRKAKSTAYKAIASMSGDSTAILSKKPNLKSNQNSVNERHWQYDLAEAYGKLQDLVLREATTPDGLDDADDYQVIARNKLLLRTPRITILNQAIVFIGELLQKNEALKAAANKLSLAATDTNTEQEQPVETVLPTPSPLPAASSIFNPTTRPRLPLQYTTDENISVPASLPGIPTSSSPHISKTTPVQLASTQNDTFMQLCMPKRRTIPVHAGTPHVDESPRLHTGHTATMSVSALSATAPSDISAASSFSSAWSGSTCTSTITSSISTRNSSICTTFPSGPGKTVAPTPSRFDTANHAASLETDLRHEIVQGGHDHPQIGNSADAYKSVHIQQDRPVAFPFSSSVAVAASNAHSIPEHPKDVKQATRSDYHAAQNPFMVINTVPATSPGVACQLAILNTPRRGSLPGDTSDGNTPNSGNSDKILHLPTMPSLKNIRIHTTSIRGRRQQRKLSNAGISSGHSTSLGENALGLSVNTSSPRVRRVVSAPGPAPASSTLTSSKPEHSFTGSMDCMPTTAAYTSHYGSATPANHAKPDEFPQVPLKEDCLKDLVLSEPTNTATENGNKGGSAVVGIEDARFDFTGLLAAADYSQMRGDEEYAVAAHPTPLANQSAQQNTPGLRYDPLPTCKPVQREMQVPRPLQQQSYGYIPYPYSTVQNSNTLPSYAPYMPCIPGYPYPSTQQPLPAPQYTDWYTSRALPKRKASPHSYEPDNTVPANQAQQMPAHDQYYAMRQYYLGQMSQSYTAPVQQSYGTAWDLSSMPALAPVHQQHQQFSQLQNAGQNITQYDYYRAGMSSRVLDPIPEHDIPSKRTRLE